MPNIWTIIGLLAGLAFIFFWAKIQVEGGMYPSEWQRFTICKLCGDKNPRPFDHAKVFREPCAECGGCDWECKVVGRYVKKTFERKAADEDK